MTRCGEKRKKGSGDVEESLRPRWTLRKGCWTRTRIEEVQEFRDVFILRKTLICPKYDIGLELKGHI